MPEKNFDPKYNAKSMAELLRQSAIFATTAVSVYDRALNAAVQGLNDYINGTLPPHIREEFEKLAREGELTPNLLLGVAGARQEYDDSLEATKEAVRAT